MAPRLLTSLAKKRFTDIAKSRGRLFKILVAELQFRLPAGAPRDTVHVALRARGRYGFTCQRCLEPMERECEVDAQILIAADADAARRLESASEVVVCAPGATLDLAALVEDEVLLALPFAPRHESGQCMAQAVEPAGVAPDVDAHAGNGNAAKGNPFAVLAALKSRDRID